MTTWHSDLISKRVSVGVRHSSGAAAKKQKSYVPAHFHYW